MPTPSITIELDLDSDSATFSKYVLTDTTDWVGLGFTLADMQGIFIVTDPMGIYYTGSFSSPDTDGSVPDMVFNTLALRQNSLNGYLLGSYSITYQAKDTSTGDIYEVTEAFEVAPPSGVIDSDGIIQTGVVTHTVNPFTLVLTITDDTNHGSYTTRSRTMYLDPPQFTGLPQVTSAGPTLTYTFSWVNTAYSLLVDTLLTYVDGAVTLSVRMQYLEAITVQIPQNLAALYDCFVRFHQYWAAQASAHGGALNLSPALRDDYFYVIGCMLAIEDAMKVQNYTVMEAQITEASATMSKYVNCDCACDDTDAPVLANPYAGGATSYTFAATYPVVVTVVGSTVTYSINAAYLAALVTITDALQSSDGSITVSSSTTGSTKTWNLVTRNHMGFTAVISYVSGNDLSCTISNEYRSGTRYVDVTGAWKSGNNVQLEGYGTFASAAELEAAPAVFYIKDFLTTSGGTPTDKLDIDIIQLLNSGAAADDYTQASLYRIEPFGKTTDKFRFRLVDAVTGLDVTVSQFISTIASMTITVKINQ